MHTDRGSRADSTGRHPNGHGGVLAGLARTNSLPEAAQLFALPEPVINFVYEAYH